MSETTKQLELIENRIMDGLKDFQQATVNRIDQLFRTGQRRILVSDEVGLGKTLIARGIIAKMARFSQEEGDKFFKTVYICSNATIASQNLQRLRITSDARTENASLSRLSMQHLNIFKQENNVELEKRFIQLIPLTPDTSFRMTAGTGTVAERALMFALLRRLPELHTYVNELEVAMKDRAFCSWDSWCKDRYEREVCECDEKCNHRYLPYMEEKLRKELNEIGHDDISYMDEIVELCRSIKNNRGEGISHNKTIRQLRVIFAKISLEKLDPDFVIMDEFQRFKYLLNCNVESETSMLANKFFYSDNVRILLLSATPYKMYSTPEEIDEAKIDEHYAEFLDVMKFLNVTKEAEEKFITVWKDYSIKLKELTLGNATILATKDAKDAAEEAMYQSVCRTERISAKENADIIDASDAYEPLSVLEQDIHSYVQVQEVLNDIGANYRVPVDYIKSTPYLMSFMRDYQLKRNVESYFKNNHSQIKKMNKSLLWLNRNDFNRYKKIPNNNARLERIMNEVLQRGVERLLWMPPSKPYYEMQGVYKGSELSSKTLIFSSWEMVPRMLACMISYEAERRTVGKIAKDYQDRGAFYFNTGERRYPSARMNFSVSRGAPSAMTLFCLLYPSEFLTECYNPITCLNEGMSLQEIRKQIRKKINDKLVEKTDTSQELMYGGQDRRWYYVAPLLLDRAEYACNWFKNKDKLLDYDSEEERGRRQKGFKMHLDAYSDLFETESFGNLGKQPIDLIDVLTDMAIASPAICINRTYNYYLGGEELPSYIPSQLARVFINRMNTPESTAVVELACGRKSDDAHWQNLLTYCCQGNLQAVFDEYAHLIASGIECNSNLITQIHQHMIEAMDIRTTQYTVDTFNNFQKRMRNQKEKPTNIRTHFSVAFTKGDEREKDIDRKRTIRNAFNSPFRPFVLATTSIGQEGLDFHNYCRKVVHWNLPSNPIDLEQREGRINRFKCLAIRQNVAQRYGDIQFKRDVWHEIFDKASEIEKTDGSSDLTPYWGLRDSEDMVKIERIVPMYPLSRDVLTYERLIKILSMYRLTLGQARQEELLKYLFHNHDEPEKLRGLFINLSPFYKELE